MRRGILGIANRYKVVFTIIDLGRLRFVPSRRGVITGPFLARVSFLGPIDLAV